MKPKKIITILLGAFVLASIACLIIQEVRRQPGKASAAGKEADGPQGDPETAGKKSKKEKKQPARRIIVYYFHGDARCKSCMTIEKYTREALEKYFTKEIQKGLIEWRVINVDEPENEHYVKDYKLFSKSVILSDMVDGKEKRWKNLKEVWELIQKKEEFLTYIRDEVRSYLKDDK
ncbi:MAG: nitrophenyl compound nitroreductase subunit ArsF family protein [Pseudomonadota bacterium]